MKKLRYLLLIGLVLLSLTACIELDDPDGKPPCQVDDSCIKATPWPTLTPGSQSPTGRATIDWTKEW